MSEAGAIVDLDWEPLQPFWTAAAAGELRIPRCNACGTWNWYPPTRCTRCGAAELPWELVSGRGTLFSWAVVHRALYGAVAEWVPYVTGLVALEEDPSVRLVTRLVDCEPAALRVDDPLEVVFRELSFAGSEQTVRAPCFSPRRT